eukprot:364803-Hanusia_phi.AAC.1
MLGTVLGFLTVNLRWKDEALVDEPISSPNMSTMVPAFHDATYVVSRSMSVTLIVDALTIASLRPVIVSVGEHELSRLTLDTKDTVI